MSGRRFATEGKRRTKCPICGGEIVISALYQVSHNYKLTKSGEMSKKYTVSKEGAEEAMIAGCASGCGAAWEEGEFDITGSGYFIDYKYRDAERERSATE